MNIRREQFLAAQQAAQAKDKLIGQWIRAQKTKRALRNH